MFLFHPDELTERDDEIRALLASGHKIGLLLDAETSDAQLRQLERGRQLLSRIAHVPVTMAHSIGLTEKDTAALRDSVFLWKSTVAADEDDLSSAQLTTLVTRAVTGAGSHVLLLDDSPTSAAALKNILISLGAKGCAFRPPTEVSLSTLN